jgi:hypothetical protein
MVHYKVFVEASMQGYSKVGTGPYKLVHFNGLVEASMQEK